MPTVLAWFDVPAPAGIAGSDLWPRVVDAARHPGPAAVISQLAQRGGRIPNLARESATDFHSKLITHHDGGEEFYDLAKDPLERHDLSASPPATFPKLRAELATALAAVARARAEGVHIPWDDLGESVRAELQALGYAGD